MRPRASLPPVANPDHVSVVAGEDAVILPLENDLDPAGGSLRLARVDGPASATVTPQFDAGSFLFRAAAAGTYYVTYQVTNGPASQLGLVRIDVSNGGSNGAPLQSGTSRGSRKAVKPWWMPSPTIPILQEGSLSSSPSGSLPDHHCPWR
ncbi:Ig-like domain-containing protein [Arthrobacter sp. SA17]